MTMLLPAAHLHVGGYQPASYVFDGSNEYLERILSTLGANDTRICTLSCWIKVPNVTSDQGSLLSVYNSVSDRECWFWVVNPDTIGWDNPGGPGGYSEFYDGHAVDDNAWHHWVLRFDSTQGTAADRVRMYRDGSQVGNSGTVPALNTTFRWFKNAIRFRIGNSYSGGVTIGNIAFIDVLEGVSAAPTDFAFDDGGTWTRIPYAGSYGTYGFSLDGTDGFNDVSGNNQHFTGVNMTVADNLDDADLPPST